MVRGMVCGITSVVWLARSKVDLHGLEAGSLVKAVTSKRYPVVLYP